MKLAIAALLATPRAPGLPDVAGDCVLLISHTPLDAAECCDISGPAVPHERYAEGREAGHGWLRWGQALWQRRAPWVRGGPSLADRAIATAVGAATLRAKVHSMDRANRLAETYAAGWRSSRVAARFLRLYGSHGPPGGLPSGSREERGG
ncbi:hypothetical protein GCM10017771_93650 [Streptomyces capitiformicae]|uniref:Uncharacterized protein n=1 Tax=Streptomyces capitiformicae TaxID=2014920 RepID=A0A919DQN1_9ACTN|nr:hypothetical protein GCM10017771_93650 [Streptomyces capitiformicae]